MSGNGTGASTDALFDSLRDLPAPRLPDLDGGLAAEIDRLAPVAPRRPLRQLAVVVMLSLLYAGLVVVVTTVRHDMPGLPRAWLVTYLAAWLVGFGVPLWLALVPARGAMMPRTNLAAAVAAVSAVGFCALGLLWAKRGPASLDGGFHAAPACLSIGLATALLPVVLGTIMLRGVAPVGSRLTAAALGAAAGSLGGFALHLHCPIADRVHVGLVHGSVVAIAAVLTAALAAGRLRPPLR